MQTFKNDFKIKLSYAFQTHKKPSKEKMFFSITTHYKGRLATHNHIEIENFKSIKYRGAGITLIELENYINDLHKAGDKLYKENRRLCRRKAELNADLTEANQTISNLTSDNFGNI